MTKASQNATNTRGSWVSGLCNFCEDPRLCCVLCVFNCNGLGQIVQRSTNRAGSCFVISCIMWGVFVTTQILSQVSNVTAQSATTEIRYYDFSKNKWDTTVHVDEEEMSVAIIIGSVSCLIALIGSVLTTYWLCTARRIIRTRDRIPEGRCGSCDDCCVSYWCSCCTLIQLFRQEQVDGIDYRLCSPLGIDV